MRSLLSPQTTVLDTNFPFGVVSLLQKVSGWVHRARRELKAGRQAGSWSPATTIWRYILTHRPHCNRYLWEGTLCLDDPFPYFKGKPQNQALPTKPLEPIGPPSFSLRATRQEDLPRASSSLCLQLRTSRASETRRKLTGEGPCPGHGPCNQHHPSSVPDSLPRLSSTYCAQPLQRQVQD